MSKLNEQMIEEEFLQEPAYADYGEELDEHEMHEHDQIFDMITKLSGAILRKAEFENDFDKVYSLVFEKIARLHHGEDFLVVLGEIGG